MSIGFQGQLYERLPAEPESIPVLRRAAADFAADNGASDPQLENVALAVSEALSNAVLHAYAGWDRPGAVELEARVREDWLEIVVCDEGSGMVPRTDSPGLGWGLPLIDRVAADLYFEETDLGVRLRMTFPVG